MKRRLLFIFSTIIIGCLSTTQVKAQMFDFDFYKYFEAHKADAAYKKTTAQDAANVWKTLGAAGAITENGISVWLEGPTRWTANTETGIPNGQPYVRLVSNNDQGIIYVTSDAPLATIAFQYRGPTDDTDGNLKIAYGTDDLSTNTAYLALARSATPPGQDVFFQFNLDDQIQYVKITRGTTNAAATGGTVVNSKIYRVVASKTMLTALPVRVLPLNLLAFTAKADAFGKTVNLNWKTTNEVNTQNFSIERRTDNTEFASIGTIASKNTDGIHNYNFTDNNPVSGNAYYRLKQIDKDGKYEYSEIQSVNVEGGVSLSLYPNPATDELNLSHAPAVSGASVKVFNIQGKAVVEQALSNGTTSSNVNVSQLLSGTYVLVLSNGGKQSTIKFVKK